MCSIVPDYQSALQHTHRHFRNITIMNDFRRNSHVSYQITGLENKYDSREQKQDKRGEDRREESREEKEKRRREICEERRGSKNKN